MTDRRRVRLVFVAVLACALPIPARPRGPSRDADERVDDGCGPRRASGVNGNRKLHTSGN